MPSRKSAVSGTDDKILYDKDEIALREARNGLLQFDKVLQLVEEFSPSKRLSLNPELILTLNRIAIEGIRRSAGCFRLVPVDISNTPHTPPPYEEVPALISEMCDYVDVHQQTSGDDVNDAIHLAAYLMWRLNWIHPFVDGNGRTSRAVSYLVLCVRLGILIPGSRTIADQIVDNRQPYYEALDSADAAWKKERVDVGQMEGLIHYLLMKQLASFSS